MRLHELTRLSELGARLRYFTCELLERALTGMFAEARVRPFGSSANGFGRYDCDVDLVLELAPERPLQVGGVMYRQTEQTRCEHSGAVFALGRAGRWPMGYGPGRDSNFGISTGSGRARVKAEIKLQTFSH